jgi:hypothetical protein
MINRTEFVPSNAAGSRKETATLLVGTAREFDIDQHSILAAQGGFWITADLAALVFDDEERGTETLYDPDDHKVGEVKAHVEANPEQAAAILAAEQEGQNRTTLVEWLTEFTNTSGNRAEKNNITEQE